ncbi:3',5'-cyclic-nucleotide phosphodiesterase [Nitrincola alkalilacustris]|uniref:3',5'-cyclic-nucleotide phosphodiesterase n=1 Tax=Nitrincola alkalilacustris TaxID=1571224 RepID=UPI00124E701F|nr:3',5'-cyclic-nucleotide phosphodiesterase [Nitrincola alkalilacustris]
MKVEILGCSGGMGANQHTTCIRIDKHTLIDAGTGLGCLTQLELAQIQRIFLTHAHLDHICFLPLLIDNLFDKLKRPIEVHALPEVIEALKLHMFNWSIWPDFTLLPDKENPVLRFIPVTHWEPIDTGTHTLTPFPSDHVVPTCGYRVEKKDCPVFVFTSDTTLSPLVVSNLNRLGPINTLMVECAMPDHMETLAKLSKHLTPSMLQTLLSELDQKPKHIWISHLKPSYTKQIIEELQHRLPDQDLVVLSCGQEFNLS